MLTIAIGVSIPVLSAASSVSSYDDCGHPLPQAAKEVKAFHNSPTSNSESGDHVSDDTLVNLCLSESTVRNFRAEDLTIVESMATKVDNTRDNNGLMPTKTEKCAGCPTLESPVSDLGAVKTSNSLQEVAELQPSADEAPKIETPTSGEFNVSSVPELNLFYYERDGSGFMLKRYTFDGLRADYDALKSGQTHAITFKPSIQLVIEGDNTECTTPSFWDTFPVVAKIRAWAKWWLNPYAWRNPSYYSLKSDDASMFQWDQKSLSANLTFNTFKDKRYLLSQLAMYLYTHWGSKLINPYIVPETQRVFDRAVELRFNRVEKEILERIGFKHVRIETRLNPISNYMEYCIVCKK